MTWDVLVVIALVGVFVIGAQVSQYVRNRKPKQPSDD